MRPENDFGWPWAIWDFQLQFENEVAVVVMKAKKKNDINVCASVRIYHLLTELAIYMYATCKV